MFDYDAELRFLREPFRAACAVRPGSRVLDVGCGGGQTTRDAAADAAPTGSVVGMDVSEAMLEHARRQTSDENVSYVLADAATYDFDSATFDTCISRFGLMFFADPPAAFANLRRALRPGGRLVAIVWQPRAAPRDRHHIVSSVEFAGDRTTLGQKQEQRPQGARPCVR